MPPPGQEYVPRDNLTEGDTLMSTLCRPMMTIVTETPEPKGVHDMHNRMCNRFLFESHGVEVQDGCHEIISKAVAQYGIAPEDMPDTMDVFMNYQHNCETRRWEILEPVSKPGDYIEFRSEMDVLVGLSNCPGGPAHRVQRPQLHPDEDRGAGALSRSSTRTPTSSRSSSSSSCDGGEGMGLEVVDRDGRDPLVAHDNGLQYPVFDLFHDPAEKLAAMDRDGIDMSLSSISPSLFLYELDPSRPCARTRSSTTPG